MNQLNPDPVPNKVHMSDIYHIFLFLRRSKYLKQISKFTVKEETPDDKKMNKKCGFIHQKK